MTQKNIRNLFIFVADALRYDYAPKSITRAGALVTTLAPSLYTPTSFASLMTAMDAPNHNVRTFSDVLDPAIKTVFDLFENGGYYDHPDGELTNMAFRNLPKAEELADTKEPFAIVERAMESHAPYGQIKHGNDLSHLELIESAYIQEMKRKGRIEDEYRRGAREVEKHFWAHVDELKDRGILDRTLVVFTSDHGELLGERFLLRKNYVHSFPPRRELVKVPTVFLNRDLGIEFMRTVDIVPTCISLMGKRTRMFECDGVDAMVAKPRTGRNFMHSPLKLQPLSLDSRWSYSERDGDLHLMNRAEIAAKSLVWFASNAFCLKILRQGFW
jgi:arylsulfatase A-like enzyme